MKEINLTLTKENELSFEKPEPYITIHIANKEAYEKLVDIIDKNTPASVGIEERVDINGATSYDFLCPNCESVISFGYTEDIARSLLTEHCPHCGQCLSL